LGSQNLTGDVRATGIMGNFTAVEVSFGSVRTWGISALTTGTATGGRMASCIVAPHPIQKRPPSGFSRPQTEQALVTISIVQHRTERLLDAVKDDSTFVTNL